MKSVYVENCADAIVAALVEPDADGATINVVDDPQPTQTEFYVALRAVGVELPRAIPVPYSVARAFAFVVNVVDRLLFGGGLRKPEFADASRLAARYKPLRYPNAHCRHVLGWEPRFSLSDACVRAVAVDPDSHGPKPQR